MYYEIDFFFIDLLLSQLFNPCNSFFSDSRESLQKKIHNLRMRVILIFSAMMATLSISHNPHTLLKNAFYCL